LPDRSANAIARSDKDGATNVLPRRTPIFAICIRIITTVPAHHSTRIQLTQSTTSDEGPESTPSRRRRFLKGTLGAAATAAAVPSLSGVAAAHFPTELAIDIQPENAENFIDLGEHDTVTVAVQQSEFLNGDGDSETFDPTERTVRYRFGSRLALEDGEGARPVDDGEVREPEDGGEDGQESLVLTFPVEETGLDG